MAKKEPAKTNEIGVVGIGASAGGLDALTQLFRELSIDTGMAFVVVSHLHRTQKSHLTEILSKQTKMPVTTIENGTKLMSNTVYIIPPNKDLALAGDFLHLSDGGRKGEPHHSVIDFFFTTLAQNRKSSAIGIVLSGTGADGTLGLKAIKSEGGITIVQDPQTAKFDGMPRSALASGIADLILSPEDIAKELLRFSKHPYTTATVPESLETEEASPVSVSASEDKDLEAILGVLKTHTQMNFSTYKPSTIRRRIQRQMMLRKIETVAKYAEYLKKNQDEVKALYEDIFIHVTEFFRDPESFEALKTKVFPEILKNLAAKQAIRVWVAGCATGEEAYSLAIYLDEYLEENAAGTPIQVFATDISEPAIQRARRGIFTPHQTRNVSLKRLDKYFEKAKDGYKVKKFIRDACIFSKHDVTSNPPIPRIDLISCRNVFIYFSPELQKRVLPVFHYALNPGGFLWLGRAENPSPTTNLFQPLDKSHKIFFKVKREIPEVQTPVYVTRLPEPIGKIAGVHSFPADSLRNVDQMILFRYSPAAVVIDAEMEIVQFRGRVAPYLEPSPGLASHNVLKMAHDDLAAALRVCIQTSKKENVQCRKENIVRVEGKKRNVTIDVSPINPTAPAKDRQYLVVFEEAEKGKAKTKTSKVKLKRVPEKLSRKNEKGQIETLVQTNTQLQQELDSSREYQQSLSEEYESAQEELTSANEELQSTNEELQSANEELGTAKEELQATNEELTSTNEELQKRNEDLQNALMDLEKSEQRFRLMISGVKDYAIFMLDPRGHIASWNEGAKRIKGYDSQEIIGQHFSKFYPEEDLKWDKPGYELREATATGRFEDEGWRIKKDGSRFWANVIITAIRDDRGQLLGFSKVTRDLTERKAAEERINQLNRDLEQRVAIRTQELQEALQKSKENEKAHQVLADSIPHMVWIANDKGAVEYCNRVVYEYSGQATKSDLTGMWSEIVHPADLPRISKVWDNALKQGEPFTADYRMKRADGQYRWHLVRTVPFRDFDGKVVRWFGTATDVHEQFEAQERNAFLAEASGILFSSLDYEKTLKSLADLAVARLADWCSIEVLEPGEIHPKTIATAHPDKEKLNNALAVANKYPRDWSAERGIPNVFRTGKPELYPVVSPEELRKAAKNEEHFKLLLDVGLSSVMALPLKSGSKTIGVMTLISSESDRRYNETDLRFAEELALRAGLAIDNAQLYKAVGDREEQLRVLFDSMAQLAWIANPDGYIYWYNKPWYEYTGTTLEEMKGWGWQRVHCPERVKDVTEQWKKAIESGQIFEMTFPIRSANGEFRTFLTRAVPFKGKDGKIQRWFGTNTDIEGQIEAQRKLEAAVHARDEFLSIASHELKTPLTSLALQIQLTKRQINPQENKAPPVERLERVFDLSERQVKRLSGLVEDLLDVSRIETGRLTLVNEDVNFSEVVKDMVERFSEQFEKANSKVDIQIEDNIHLNGDHARLEQVIDNLLSNAIKYAAQSPVNVKLQQIDGSALLEIADKGPGIPRERQGKIFERYERATPSRNISGLGLGLYIVREIIKAHQGSVALESDSGKGAKFIISLPTKKKSGSPAQGLH